MTQYERLAAQLTPYGVDCEERPSSGLFATATTTTNVLDLHWQRGPDWISLEYYIDPDGRACVGGWWVSTGLNYSHLSSPGKLRRLLARALRTVILSDDVRETEERVVWPWMG